MRAIFLAGLTAMMLMPAVMSAGEVATGVDQEGRRSVVLKDTRTALKPGEVMLIAVVAQSADEPKPSKSFLMVSAFHDSGRWASCSNVEWAVEGKAYSAMPKVTYHSKAHTGHVSEILDFDPVPLETFARFAHATNIKFRVCDDEISMTADQLADLKQFADVLGAKK